jgi:hypothetical protein
LAISTKSFKPISLYKQLHPNTTYDVCTDEELLEYSEEYSKELTESNEFYNVSEVLNALEESSDSTEVPNEVPAESTD